MTYSLSARLSKAFLSFEEHYKVNDRPMSVLQDICRSFQRDIIEKVQVINQSSSHQTVSECSHSDSRRAPPNICLCENNNVFVAVIIVFQTGMY